MLRTLSKKENKYGGYNIQLLSVDNADLLVFVMSCVLLN